MLRSLIASRARKLHLIICRILFILFAKRCETSFAKIQQFSIGCQTNYQKKKIAVTDSISFTYSYKLKISFGDSNANSRGGNVSNVHKKVSRRREKPSRHNWECIRTCSLPRNTNWPQKLRGYRPYKFRYTFICSSQTFLSPLFFFLSFSLLSSKLDFV